MLSRPHRSDFSQVSFLRRGRRVLSVFERGKDAKVVVEVSLPRRFGWLLLYCLPRFCVAPVSMLRNDRDHRDLRVFVSNVDGKGMEAHRWEAHAKISGLSGSSPLCHPRRTDVALVSHFCGNRGRHHFLADENDAALEATGAVGREARAGSGDCSGASPSRCPRRRQFAPVSVLRSNRGSREPLVNGRVVRAEATGAVLAAAYLPRFAGLDSEALCVEILPIAWMGENMSNRNVAHGRQKGKDEDDRNVAHNSVKVAYRTGAARSEDAAGVEDTPEAHARVGNVQSDAAEVVGTRSFL